MSDFSIQKSQNLIRHQMQALNHAKLQPSFAQQQAFLQQQILIQKLAMQNLQQVKKKYSRTYSRFVHVMICSGHRIIVCSDNWVRG